MRYNASWSYISSADLNIESKGFAILVDYGRKKRGKTEKSYVAAEEHALLSRVSIFHRTSAITAITAVI